MEGRIWVGVGVGAGIFFMSILLGIYNHHNVLPSDLQVETWSELGALIGAPV